MFVSSSVQARPQHLNLRSQLCKAEMDVLVVQKWLSERFSLLEVLNGLPYDLIHWGETECYSCHPLLLELHHLVCESHALVRYL